MPTLSVELNADGVHSMTAPDRFSTDGPFAVEFVNSGQAVHVFVNADDDLSTVANVRTTNHYVDAESRERVQIDVNPDRPDRTVRGKLKIVVGHGATTEYVNVVVAPAEEEDEEVIVDESLAQPPDPEPEPSGLEVVAERVDDLTRGRAISAPAILFAAFAVVVAIAVGFTVNSPIVFAGVAVVVVAALVAVALVLSDQV